MSFRRICSLVASMLLLLGAFTGCAQSAGPVRGSEATAESYASYRATPHWRLAAYGNGLFVVMGAILWTAELETTYVNEYGGSLSAISETGRRWRTELHADDFFPTALVFDARASRFLASSVSGEMWASADGRAWQAMEGTRLNSLASGNGYDVGVGRPDDRFDAGALIQNALSGGPAGSRSVYVRRDPASAWQLHSAKTAVRAIAFGTGRFLGVGNQYRGLSPAPAVFLATDPLAEWQAGFLPAEFRGVAGAPEDGPIEVAQLYSVAAGGDWFVAVGLQERPTHASIARSRDGLDWAPVLTQTGTLNATAYGEGSFLAVGARGIFRSRDLGKSWRHVRRNSPLNPGNERLKAIWTARFLHKDE